MPQPSLRSEAHLNLRVRGLPISATLAINEQCDRLLAEGQPVYRLGLGQSPFPVPLPVVEELKANAHQKSYLPVRGLPALRAAVADYGNRTHGLTLRAEDVLIGPGSKELMFILLLVYYGDLVIPTPSWVSYAPQAHIVGRQVHWLPTTPNQWLLTPEALDRFCRKDPTRPRIVILNYPNNPTGCSYSPEQLQALADVARRYRLVLLSDEIYGELHFTGRHRSIARYYPEGTIISGGLSKWCGAGGWRLGTFVFPESLGWLLNAMATVASESFTSTSAPIQYAAVRAFRGGLRIERYLWQSRRILQTLGTELRRRLLAAGLAVAEPCGGFYLFPDASPLRESLAARNIFDSERLCQQLLADTGVAILPGTVFGRPPEELTARIACVDFDGARALAAAEQVAAEDELGGDFLESWCGRMLTAVDRMCQWLRDSNVAPDDSP
jgi:aspartate aminotransferase